MEKIHSRTTENNGITYTITHYLEEYPDLSHYGEFTNRWEYGAIKTPARYTNRGGSPWFIPAMTFRDHVNGWEKHWISERWARIMAAQYMLQDMQRVIDYERGEWVMILIEVVASFKGVELGSEMIGGFESDGDLTEYENEIIDSLQHDLPKAIEQKIATYQQRAAILTELRDTLISKISVGVK